MCLPSGDHVIVEDQLVSEAEAANVLHAPAPTSRTASMTDPSESEAQTATSSLVGEKAAALNSNSLPNDRRAPVANSWHTRSVSGLSGARSDSRILAPS